MPNSTGILCHQIWLILGWQIMGRVLELVLKSKLSRPPTPIYFGIRSRLA